MRTPQIQARELATASWKRGTGPRPLPLMQVGLGLEWYALFRSRAEGACVLESLEKVLGLLWFLPDVFDRDLNLRVAVSILAT